MSADGVLLIDSREYRLQSRNREAARARLADLIRQALIQPRKRRATKPKAGAREKRLAGKKLRGEIKTARPPSVARRVIRRPPPSATRYDARVRFYYFEIIGTAVFAVTGVLAVTRRGLDIFGAAVLGMVTALGGGTVRDVIIGAPPFWLGDANYIWAAAAGALAAFWIGARFRNTYRGLLYLDALGAALFAMTAADKVLMRGLIEPVAVIMGVLTGIGGGLIRDVLAGPADAADVAGNLRHADPAGMHRLRVAAINRAGLPVPRARSDSRSFSDCAHSPSIATWRCRSG